MLAHDPVRHLIQQSRQAFLDFVRRFIIQIIHVQIVERRRLLFATISGV